MSSEAINNNNTAAEHPETPNPAEDQTINEEHTQQQNSSTTDRPKRNCGRTGPTTSEGRAASSRNATRHGMCSETIILRHESEADWLNVLQTWLDEYRNPEENSILYNFIFQTARAEWFQLRAQKEYDNFFQGHGTPPITAWEPSERMGYDLVQRYLTTAERRFQRQYRLLEQHWKTHHKPAPEPKKSTTKPEEDFDPDEKVRTLYVNNDTGEAVDAFGNEYPPPPNYKPEPIIPGVYGPDHPSNWRPKKKR